MPAPAPARNRGSVSPVCVTPAGDPSPNSPSGWQLRNSRAWGKGTLRGTQTPKLPSPPSRGAQGPRVSPSSAPLQVPAAGGGTARTPEESLPLGVGGPACPLRASPAASATLAPRNRIHATLCPCNASVQPMQRACAVLAPMQPGARLPCMPVRSCSQETPSPCPAGARAMPPSRAGVLHSSTKLCGQRVTLSHAGAPAMLAPSWCQRPCGAIAPAKLSPV